MQAGAAAHVVSPGDAPAAAAAAAAAASARAPSGPAAGAVLPTNEDYDGDDGDFVIRMCRDTDAVLRHEVLMRSASTAAKQQRASSALSSSSVARAGAAHAAAAAALPGGNSTNRSVGSRAAVAVSHAQTAPSARTAGSRAAGAPAASVTAATSASPLRGGGAGASPAGASAGSATLFRTLAPVGAAAGIPMRTATSPAGVRAASVPGSTAVAAAATTTTPTGQPLRPPTHVVHAPPLPSRAEGDEDAVDVETYALVVDGVEQQISDEIRFAIDAADESDDEALLRADDSIDARRAADEQRALSLRAPPMFSSVRSVAAGARGAPAGGESWISQQMTLEMLRLRTDADVL